MMKIDIQLYFVSDVSLPAPSMKCIFSHYTKNYQEVDVYPGHWHSCREVLPTDNIYLMPRMLKDMYLLKNRHDSTLQMALHCPQTRDPPHVAPPPSPASLSATPPSRLHSHHIPSSRSSHPSLLSAPHRGRICMGSWPVLPTPTGARPPPTWL